MLQAEQITIFTDKLAREHLESQLAKFGLLDICKFKNHLENVIILRYGSSEVLYKLPARIGQIIDQITRFKASELAHSTTNLVIGEHILDTNLGTFTNTVNKKIAPIQLTEKEVNILQYLYDNKGRTVTREELLGAVWGYAQNVETHTLETHIYRLRQKIEANPSDPTILKTADNGYFISLELTRKA